MSRLEELIRAFCPEGVCYSVIGDVTNYEQPGRYIVKSTDYNDNYAVPVLTAGQTFILGKTNETDGIYEASKSSPVIIFDDFTGAFKWVDFRFKVKSSAMKLLTANEERLSLRYLYHVMGNIGYTSDEHKRLWIATYSLFRIPLPPLAVQQEIVRILDSFTERTEELNRKLEEELTARRKQYEYYRDELLTADAIVERTSKDTWKTIADICKNICSGGTPKSANSQYYGGDIPWLRTQEIDWNDINDTEIKITQAGIDNSSAKIIPKNCVIVAMYGATAGKAAINKIPLATNQACCNLEIDESKALYRYVFHWLSKEYKEIKAMGQGSQSNINAQIIKKYPIPIVPLEIQQRIVNVLDNFDAICSSLNIGLPAEIAAHQKQYEYYRDKLLTFKELETN